MELFLNPPVWLPATGRRSDVDHAINRLLHAQGDAISAEQLGWLGINHEGVARRVAAHRLYAADVGNGIYTSKPGPLLMWGRHCAAQLWQPLGCLCDTSAASRHELEKERGALVHMLFPHDRRPAPAPGIKIHRTRVLPAADIVEVDGMRCASVARVLLDIAANATPNRLDRLVDRAVHLNRYDGYTLADVMAARPTAAGIRKLMAALATLDENSGRARSEFERRCLAMLKTQDRIPQPALNPVVEGMEPDLWFPGTRALVELDGRDFHRSPAQIARDAKKEAALFALGFVILRLRWSQVVYYPHVTLPRIIAFVLQNQAAAVPGHGRIAA